MDKHVRKPDQPVRRNLTNRSFFQDLGQLYSLRCDSGIVEVYLKEHLIHAILTNCAIIDQDNWSQSSFLEA